MHIAMPPVDVDGTYRRAVACWYGDHGRPAARKEVRDHLAMYGTSTDDDMLAVYDDCEECHPKAKETTDG